MKKHFKLLGTALIMMLCLGISQGLVAQQSLSPSISPVPAVNPIEGNFTTEVQEQADGTRKVKLTFNNPLDNTRVQALNDAVASTSYIEWANAPSVGSTTTLFHVLVPLNARELNKVFISRGFRLDKNVIIQNF